jgi:hypothetical protein
MNELDLLSPDLQRLLQLFSSLPEVRFPDLDLSMLQDAVARVKERHLELLHVEAQLAAVRSALDDEQEALLKKGHRLHAYLKVFSESDEVLAEKVNAIALPRPRRAAVSREEAFSVDGTEVKRRGRPRKVQSTAELALPVAPNESIDEVHFAEAN